MARRSCRVLMQGCVETRQWKNECALTNLLFKMCVWKEMLTIRTYPTTINKTVAQVVGRFVDYNGTDLVVLRHAAVLKCFSNCQTSMRTCKISDVTDTTAFNFMQIAVTQCAGNQWECKQ